MRKPYTKDEAAKIICEPLPTQEGNMLPEFMMMAFGVAIVFCMVISMLAVLGDQ